MQYEVQQLIGGEWECSCFDDGEPVQFDRLADAVQDLVNHLSALGACGMAHDPADFRIVEV